MSAGDGQGPPEDVARGAPDVVSEAVSMRRGVYDHVDTAADLFIENSGQMYPKKEAVNWISNELGVDFKTAARVVEDLVSDTVDPVTTTTTDDGTFVGAVAYQEQDFYYEYDEFHDLLGQVTTGVCVPCVEEATFDHEAVQFPEVHQHNKQAQASVARPGVGSLGHGATSQERREVLGQHYLDEHTSISPSDVADGAGPGVVEAREQMGYEEPDGQRYDTNTEVLNDRTTTGDLIRELGISFDDVVAAESIDTGVDQIQVGATLVSGTTIAGNTAAHGGNLSNFNVEDFGTSSTTQGEVPTSDGSGGLTMSSPGGGGGGALNWTHITTINQTGSDSASHNLSNTWRELAVRITDVTNESGGGTYLNFNVNGVGSSYDFIQLDSNSRTGQNQIFAARLDNADSPGQVHMVFDGQFTENWGGFCQPRCIRNDVATSFQNNTVGSPINTFGFSANNSDNWAGTVEIFGRNPV